MLSPQDIKEHRLAASEIAEALDAQDPDGVATLERVVASLGAAAARQLLVQAWHCEEVGGMMTVDGTCRRRSPRDVYLWLVATMATPEQAAQIWPALAALPDEAPTIATFDALPDELLIRVVRMLLRDDPQAAARLLGSSRALRQLTSLVRTQQPDGAVQFYEGDFPQEQLVRMDQPDGSVELYEGALGEERLVRAERDGMVGFFEGEQGAERQVRIELPDGIILFFQGEKGAERQVRAERAGDGHGDVELYDGEKGAERIVRIERGKSKIYNIGQVELYEGERVTERLVRVDLPNGTVEFYEGERGAERLVRTEQPDGSFELYEGERGAERLVRQESPDLRDPLADAEYCTLFYEGEKNEERLVRRQFYGSLKFYGSLEFFEGGCDVERLVRRETADGTIYFYEGEMGAERVVRVERHAGSAVLDSPAQVSQGVESILLDCDIAEITPKMLRTKLEERLGVPAGRLETFKITLINQHIDGRSTRWRPS